MFSFDVRVPINWMCAVICGWYSVVCEAIHFFSSSVLLLCCVCVGCACSAVWVCEWICGRCVCGIVGFAIYFFFSFFFRVSSPFPFLLDICSVRRSVWWNRQFVFIRIYSYYSYCLLAFPSQFPLSLSLTRVPCFLLHANLMMVSITTASAAASRTNI